LPRAAQQPWPSLLTAYRRSLTFRKRMKKALSKRLTSAQRIELRLLDARRDEEIDTSDAPELLDWSGAKRGLFYRPSQVNG
jgi:hypothetical protein